MKSREQYLGKGVWLRARVPGSSAAGDDSFGRLDDDDYPVYTMGRAAEMIGTTQSFLRATGEARLITPLRSEWRVSWWPFGRVPGRGKPPARIGPGRRVERFAFDGGEEGLGQCVVPALSGAADREPDPDGNPVNLTQPIPAQ